MKTDTIRLRRASRADAEALWQLRIRAIRSGCRNHYSPEIIAAWTSNPMPASFLSLIGEEPFFIAQSGSSILGFAGLKRATSEINALFVSPEASRAGVGKKLLEQLEEVARTMKLPILRLNASLNSVPFYRAAGYAEGPQGMHTTTSGLLIACVPMKKYLV